ncbi:helix-turn-helix domain-containing protein [candidate division GN15 bacterium]|nr:helix-turn-helix domain-containing protein [candidate division GN15 bacterium]
MLSTLVGLYDILNCFENLGRFDEAVPIRNPFQVEIVSSSKTGTDTASGLAVPVHKTLAEVEDTSVVIVPALAVQGTAWEKGRYPEMVRWLKSMHRRGALLCSACSGVLLLAETGLLDGHDATVHWANANTFRANFPKVRLRLEKTLVSAGGRQEFIMSGGSASWHDLVLYLIAQQLGPRVAQAIARFTLLQWHVEGQAPYIPFSPPMEHDDSIVLNAQRWLEDNYTTDTAIDDMVNRSGLAERTFKRRFRNATNCAPIGYVQHLRVEQAKRRLELSDQSVDEISWEVGYEDPAFFRRLFKRITQMTPGAYRKRFRVPELTRS